MNALVSCAEPVPVPDPIRRVFDSPTVPPLFNKIFDDSDVV